MEQKHIIIILLIVVVVLAATIAAMTLQSTNAQKDSKIAIVSNKTLYECDNLTVKLTDLNKTPIKKEFVNVTVVDKDGKVVVNKSIKTDSKGKATFKLGLDAGKYTVNASFEGNENFTGNNTTKKITIKEEEVVEEQVHQPSSGSSQSSSDDGVAEYREFDSWDYAPGMHVQETTYKNGDIEHHYDDGSSDYYDSSAHEWRYKNADGSEGSMSV